MLKILRNLFYKDTHVVVKAGGHMEAEHVVKMSTVITGNEIDTWNITRDTQHWPEKIGTYSAIDIDDLFDPEAVVFWLVFNQEMGSVDVAGTIECDGVKPLVYFGVNNPMIGTPYCTIWSKDGSIQYKHQLTENTSFMFSDHAGHNIIVERLGDTDYKEWVITIDPVAQTRD
jgi:hypothetical protein